MMMLQELWHYCVEQFVSTVFYNIYYSLQFHSLRKQTKVELVLVAKEISVAPSCKAYNDTKVNLYSTVMQKKSENVNCM